MKFLLKFFFALNILAKQARKLREKLRRKLREKLHPELPPSETETSPKTSLCRNPLLAVPAFNCLRMFKGIFSTRERLFQRTDTQSTNA